MKNAKNCKSTLSTLRGSKAFRRLIAVLLTLTMVTAMFTPSAFAASKSGKCGKNVNWSYDTSTKTLTISGKGAMYSYNEKDTPWDIGNFEDNITKIVVKSGVTKIGTEDFEGLDRLTSVTLPDTLTQINRQAFEGCDRLTKITIPKNVSVIGQEAFGECNRLKTVVFKGNAPTTFSNRVFEDVTATVTYPANNKTWTKSVLKAYGGKLTWKDSNGKKASSTSSNATGSQISRSKAKSIALKRAGLSASQIRAYEIELDRENGKWVYEISFKSGNMEYDFEIDASNGKILHWEKERDD